MTVIDLNCDFGESFGCYKLGSFDMLRYVSSVNVACGFHAGDPMVIHETVKRAKAAGVAIGAHPGFPDLQGFGRRNMQFTEDEIYALTVYQLGALEAFCKIHQTTVGHVKPHGALYNMAAIRDDYARAIAKAVYDVNQNLVLVGLSGSALLRAGQEVGIRVVSEVFADRHYESDGTLTPRTAPNAMITDDEECVAQVLQMILDGTVTASNGSVIPIEAHTVCLHGDGAHALAFAKCLQDALTENNIAIGSFKTQNRVADRD